MSQITKIPSKLETRVQALVDFLFDVASMTNALLEFEVGVYLILSLVVLWSH